MAMSKLKSAASKKSSSPKTNVPEVVASAEIVQAIKDFRAAKKAQTEAKRRIEDAEERMLDEALEERIQACRRDGELYASIRLIADDGSVLCTQKSQCRKINGEHEDVIRSILGEEDFDNLFRTNTTFSFNEEKLHELGLAKVVEEALMKALGDKVSEVLNVESTLVPTKEYYRAIIFSKKMQAKIRKLQENGFGILHKPSFK